MLDVCVVVCCLTVVVCDVLLLVSRCALSVFVFFCRCFSVFFFFFFSPWFVVLSADRCVMLVVWLLLFDVVCCLLALRIAGWLLAVLFGVVRWLV